MPIAKTTSANPQPPPIRESSDGANSAFCDWLTSIDWEWVTEVWHPWFGSILTGASILLGAYMVSWQVKKQLENGRTLQQTKDRDDRWLAIYRDLTSAISRASGTLGDLSAYMNSMVNDLRFAMEQGGPVAQERLLRRNAEGLSDLQRAAASSIAHLVETIERNELAKPELGIFKMAFSVAAHDLSDDFWPLYHDCLIHLPMEVSAEMQRHTGIDKFVPPLPNEGQLLEIDAHAGNYQASIDQAQDFIFDLGIEAQNQLLGSLFDNRLSPRRPLDPSVIVVVTEPEDAVRRLREHFDRTRWGKASANAEEAVRRAAANPAQ